MIESPAILMDSLISDLYSICLQAGLLKFVLAWFLIFLFLLFIDVLGEFLAKYLRYKRIPKTSFRRLLGEYLRIIHSCLFFFVIICLMSYYPSFFGLLTCILLLYFILSFMRIEPPAIRVKRENLKNNWFDREFPYYFVDNPKYKETIIDKVGLILFPYLRPVFYFD